MLHACNCLALNPMWLSLNQSIVTRKGIELARALGKEEKKNKKKEEDRNGLGTTRFCDIDCWRQCSFMTFLWVYLFIYLFYAYFVS